jgi:hypothetical protein
MKSKMNWDFKKIFAGRPEAIPEPDNAPSLVGDLIDLSIRGFMRCLFHNDYSVLIIKGKASEEMLRERWDRLYEDYAVATDNTNYTRLMTSMREYIRITGKLISAEAGLTILQCRYDAEAADGIRQLGYNLQFNPKDRKAYDRDLHALLTNCKTLRAKVSIQAGEIEKIKNEAGKNKQATEQDFLTGITIVSKHMGYRIDPATCSIGEYAEYQRQYNLYVSRENAKTNK